MNAFELLLPDHRGAGVWVCHQCKRTWSDESGAQACCCCSYCGLPTKIGDYAHEECKVAHRAEILAQRIEKAQKLETWNGWVYLEDYGSKEGYFSSLDQLLQNAELDKMELPQWVFVCDTVPFPAPNADDLLDNISSESYEDVLADVDGVEPLRLALAEFAKANEALVSYEPDYTRVVRTRCPQT